MRIAMFYYAETDTNADGKFDRQIMQALCADHDITVFSMAFDNPVPERIRYVRIPAFPGPLFLLLAYFHLVAPAIYLAHSLRHRVRFDAVHFHDVDLPFGDVAYANFCNRAYLDRPDADSPRDGLRPLVRWLEHRLRALIEPIVFRRVPRIVIPSIGILEELERYFGPEVAAKATIIPNFVPVEHLSRHADFDAAAIREELGWGPDDLVAVFVALGHYERKGLPILLEAMRRLGDDRVKLVMVGGSEAGARRYLDQAEAWGLRDQIRLIETRADIRPFLWAADVFTFPTRYEASPLVAYEAAAAGLPLLVTPVNGVLDLLEDSVNGWVVSTDPDDMASRLRFCLEHREVLAEMGARAAKKAAAFDEENYGHAWRALYEDVRRDRRNRARTAPSAEAS